MELTVAIIGAVLAAVAVFGVWRGNRRVRRLEDQLARILKAQGLNPESPEQARRRGRWWVRYRLRTLLLLFVVLGAGLAWFGHHWHQAQRQAAAVESLRDVHYEVEIVYDYQVEGEVWFNDSQKEPPGPKWLRDWLGVDFFADVTAVSLGTGIEPTSGAWGVDDFLRIEVTDDDLIPLRDLPAVETLGLGWCDITDTGIDSILELNRLKALVLSGTRVSDAGLPKLTKFANLQRLYLESCAVGEAGLADVARIESLRIIDLSGVNVSPAGIRHLAKLPDLNTLVLKRCTLSDECVAALAELKSLRVLDINASSVGDEQVALLQRLPRLRRLDLDNTPITKQSLPQLKQFTRLTGLSCNGTQLDEEDEAELRAALPNTRVDIAPVGGFFQ